jgi:hypothetical protein
MLLDPEYQNPELRAYAFLSVQYQSGVRSPVDCLQPFVVYAVSSFAGSQLNLQDVRNFLKTKYGLNVPFYMLERMQPQLMHVGALERTAIQGVYLCKDARPPVGTKSVDFSISDIDDLGYALTKFAEAVGMPTPATAPSWPDIIIPFFLHGSPSGDKAVATVKGVIVSDPKSVDFSILADFIVDQWHKKTNLYKVVERLYYGALAANFLTQIEEAGDKSSFRGLIIIYDTPVMLRLLGCCGNVLREATEDLNDTLRDLGCRTFYFSHTYDEMTTAIEAMVKCYESGTPMFRDTQEALKRNEITIGNIYGIRAELDHKLAALGLTEFGRGYSSRSSDDFQIDEAAFREKLLQGRTWGGDGSTAAEKDVMSLALIMRLREGKEVREVSKSRYIFLTHNSALANRSRDFLREERQLREGSVWPIMTVGQLSTIAWVVNETFQDNRKITKELIADCYAAAIPDSDFDEKLREILTKTDPSKTHELYKNAFVVQSIRQVALGQTGGHSALVRTLDTSELLASAAEVRELAMADARIDGRTAAINELTQQRLTDREAKVRQLAGGVAKVIVLALLLTAGAVALWQAGLLGGDQKPQFVLTALGTLFTLYGALDLFGYVSAASLTQIIERYAARIIRKLQQALT